MKLFNFFHTGILAAFAFALSAHNLSAQGLPAGEIYDTNNSIIANITGSGPAYGPFVSGSDNNFQTGLFAYDPVNNAVPTNGLGLYTFTNGRPWDVSFFINSNVDASANGPSVADSGFFLQLDTNPGLGTTVEDVDPLSLPNDVFQGNNIAAGFFDYRTVAPLADISPGMYRIELGALNSDASDFAVLDFINVKVVPRVQSVPDTSATLLLTGFGVLAICALFPRFVFSRI